MDLVQYSSLFVCARLMICFRLPKFIPLLMEIRAHQQTHSGAEHKTKQAEPPSSII
jgi:uncharacterized Zn-finger protein